MKGGSTLTAKEVPQERFLNRSAWMANQYKTEPDAYGYEAPALASIDPAPAYPVHPLFNDRSNRGLKVRRANEALEETKSGII